MHEYIIILRLKASKLITKKPLQMQWLFLSLKYDLIHQVFTLGHI